MHIALFGEQDDPQIQHVASALSCQRHCPVVLNTRHFGTHWQLVFDPEKNDGKLIFQDDTVALSHVSATYWHRYMSPEPPDGITDIPHYQSECNSTLQSWMLSPQTRWVNSLEAIRYHHCKPAQLAHAKRLGANIPATLAGPVSSIHATFFARSPALIVKPVKGGQTASRMTVNELGTLGAFSPHTVQTCIEGTNIRSYVFGNEVVHIRLDTDYTDYRDDHNVKPVHVTAPAGIDALAVLICQSFGMHWCAIDWRLGSDGHYVFLEANPCPYFLFVENQTGIDLTGRLLNLLTGPCHKTVTGPASHLQNET